MSKRNTSKGVIGTGQSKASGQQGSPGSVQKSGNLLSGASITVYFKASAVPKISAAKGGKKST